MPTKVFVDTNILLNQNFKFEDYEKVFISIISLEEIDGLKKSLEVGYKARSATKRIKSATNVVIKIDYDFSFENRFLEHKADNYILGFGWQVHTEDSEVVFLTDDYNLYIKAYAIGLDCDLFQYKEMDENTYKGYKEVTLGDFELASFYETPINKFDLLTNEYLIIRDKSGQIVDKQRWDGKKFSPLTIGKKDKLDFTYTEKIKPRNVQQEIAFDLFQNRDINIKIIFGKHGSGKDLIMATHALSMIKQGVYDKLIFVRNNYEVAGSNPIGFLPGSQDDKLLPYVMPLADHVGGVDGLVKLIDDGVVVLQHLGFIRGRNISKSLIYVTEAENMTKEHIQLLISRLAEGSALWLNGDFKQIDDSLFERNNGLKQTISKLKGQQLFGCVELNITERSITARLADLLD
ncbi:MAG TPA: PhoH family protein [Clostridium sp.]